MSIFYDKWVPVSEMLDMLPLKVPDVDEYLDKNRHVEFEGYGFPLFLECERLSLDRESRNPTSLPVAK